MKNTKIYHWTISQAALLLICFLSIIGAAVYKLYSLNWLGVLITLLIAGAAAWAIYKYSEIERPQFDWKLHGKGPEIFYLLLWILNIYLLWQARSGEAIVSPWTEVGPLFFISFGALTLSLLYLASKSSRCWLACTCLYLMVCYGVAVLVYGVGYGFDPFVHQATMKFIDEFGAVSPKPLYYAGQYALEVITHKVTNVPLPDLDKILVPGLAAIFLPLLMWQNFKNIFADLVVVRLLIVVLTAALASIFLITTPQNLAYLFLALLVISTMSGFKTNWLLNYSLAFAALVTQPVAGIPALLAVGSLHLYNSAIPYRKIFVAASLVLLSLLIPLSFFLIDRSYSPGGHLSFNNFSSAGLVINFPNKYSPWLNFAQAWSSLLIIIIIIAVLAGYLCNRHLEKAHDNHYRLYLWQGLAMTIAYLLTKLISFNFLIDYERDNYANRMLICALIFWLPLIAIALYELIILILAAEKKQQIIWAIMAACLLTTNLYTSYPRHDDYLDSHSYATSAHDIAAVKWIAQDAEQQDYIVLANQQVSAAALRQFGFAKYYGDNIFYYPVPTGGILYQYYLEIVKEPNLAAIKTAGQLVGVKEVYVVINEYWWQAQRLIGELDLIASEHEKIAGGKVHVFKFIWK